MAKKNKNPKITDDATKPPSIGGLMTGSSQRDRNLAAKKQMIENGEREEPVNPPRVVNTQRERNLALKAELKAQRDGEESEGTGE